VPRLEEKPALTEGGAGLEKVVVLGAEGRRVLIVDDNVDAADAPPSFLISPATRRNSELPCRASIGAIKWPAERCFR